MPDTRRGDIAITLENHVATVEIRRPPHNFFSHALIRDLADTFAALDAETECRAILLCSEGKAFCAGADFAGDRIFEAAESRGRNPLYDEAVRLFGGTKPVVAAIQGAAIGGGLGLALVADLRVACPEARFAANFVRLGIHPGFGLTHTLPRVVGQQRASLMFLTGRRIGGEEAAAWGLVDQLVPQAALRDSALALAAEIAEAAPLAVQSTRLTLRRHLAAAVREQTDREGAEQAWLARTDDHQEGISAVAERRAGRFAAR